MTGAPITKVMQPSDSPRPSLGPANGSALKYDRRLTLEVCRDMLNSFDVLHLAIAYHALLDVNDQMIRATGKLRRPYKRSFYGVHIPNRTNAELSDRRPGDSLE